jgi:hypothetical protein
VDETEVVERVALRADDESAEVAQPSKEPLDLPAAPEAAQLAAILRLRLLPVAAVWDDQRDT